MIISLLKRYVLPTLSDQESSFHGMCFLVQINRSNKLGLHKYVIEQYTNCCYRIVANAMVVDPVVVDDMVRAFLFPLVHCFIDVQFGFQFLARVPMQGLSNVVPPQIKESFSPDGTSTTTNFTSHTQTTSKLDKTKTVVIYNSSHKPFM